MQLHEIVASGAYKRFGDAYLPNGILDFVYELTRVAKLPKSLIPENRS